MKTLILTLGVIFASSVAVADNSRANKLKKEGANVITVDSYGRAQHNKPKYVVKDNCLIPTDMFGKPQYHKERTCYLQD